MLFWHEADGDVQAPTAETMRREWTKSCCQGRTGHWTGQSDELVNRCQPKCSEPRSRSPISTSSCPVNSAVSSSPPRASVPGRDPCCQSGTPRATGAGGNRAAGKGSLGVLAVLLTRCSELGDEYDGGVRRRTQLGRTSMGGRDETKRRSRLDSCVEAHCKMKERGVQREN